jgi:2-polyprenyl-3-methyl-5-hydroxy-6-metoxy-1,4-benzoquinol methylase
VDEVARYNIARWKALAAANAPFSRPMLDLDATSARAFVDPEELLGEIAGREVLCLAGGGGKQSVAFALLGARVTVADLSEAQLARDRAAAAHYGVAIEAVQADMRDLDGLPAATFDIVHQPYALNFVPEADAVFREVARVLRPGGRYYLQCANPFSIGVGTRDWNGEGYTLRQPYAAGGAILYADEDWVYSGSAGEQPVIPAPREYRHTLGTIVNGLAGRGFVLRHLEEFKDMTPDPGAEPGSWQHLTVVAPPWLALWWDYRPDLLARPAGGNN